MPKSVNLFECLFKSHNKIFETYTNTKTTNKQPTFSFPPRFPPPFPRTIGTQSVKTAVIVMGFHRMDLFKYVKHRKKRRQPFTDLELMAMMKGLLNGIYHLHKQIIVHRDIHPGNVFVDHRRGRIWIGDFGCCLNLKEINEGKFLVKKDHECMWEMMYPSSGKAKKKYYKFWNYGASSVMAPEIDKFDINECINYEKYDLYSLGCVMEYLISLDKERVCERIKSLVKRLKIENPNVRIGYEDAIKEAEECMVYLMKKK